MFLVCPFHCFSCGHHEVSEQNIFIDALGSFPRSGRFALGCSHTVVFADKHRHTLSAPGCPGPALCARWHHQAAIPGIVTQSCSIRAMASHGSSWTAIWEPGLPTQFFGAQGRAFMVRKSTLVPIWPWWGRRRSAARHRHGGLSLWRRGSPVAPPLSSGPLQS